MQDDKSFIDRITKNIDSITRLNKLLKENKIPEIPHKGNANVFTYLKEKNIIDEATFASKMLSFPNIVDLENAISEVSSQF